jgi:hypothetical protein
VSLGVDELDAGAEPLGRVRRPGGGRKRAADPDPGLLPALLALVEPDERGDPMSPLRWTTKSTRTLAAELTAQGHKVSADLVISVDTKKKELVGEFRNAGRQWRRRGQPAATLVHDFPEDAIGKAVSYGIYDLTANAGWVNVGTDHDTAAFAVESVRRWWNAAGQGDYNVVHTGLSDLGLEPHLLSDTLIGSLFEITKRYAHRVRPESLRPTVQWRVP